MESIYDDNTPSGLSYYFWKAYFEKYRSENKELYEGRILRFKKRIEDLSLFPKYVEDFYKHQLEKHNRTVKYYKEVGKQIIAKHCDSEGRFILNDNNHPYGKYFEEGQSYWGKDLVWSAEFEPIIEHMFRPLVKNAINQLQENGLLKITSIENGITNFVLLNIPPINDLISSNE
jgi:hypothetical protein